MGNLGSVRKLPYTFLDTVIPDDVTGLVTIAVKVYPNGRVETLQKIIDANNEDYGRFVLTPYEFVTDSEFGLQIEWVEELERDLIFPTPTMAMRYGDIANGMAGGDSIDRIMFKKHGEKFMTEKGDYDD